MEARAASENIQNREEQMEVSSGRRKLRQTLGMKKKTRSRSRNRPLPRARHTCEKTANRFRCVLWNGSAWSTEKKYMKGYKGTFDIFFGIEHRMRKEEM